jgi:hypothetical protein
VRTPGAVDGLALESGLNTLIELRQALNTVLENANTGTLNSDHLAQLADAMPEGGAAPFLAGELLSVAAVRALDDLAALDPGQLAPLLAYFNADPDRPTALSNLTELLASPVLFPALNGAGDTVVFGTAGDDTLAVVAGMLPEDADILILPGNGEDLINLTATPDVSSNILYQAGLVGAVDTITGFDVAADAIGYAVAGGTTFSLHTQQATSASAEDISAALANHVFGAADIQFVLIDPEGGDPLLFALTEQLVDNPSPDSLASLAGVNAADFSVNNLFVLTTPSEV